MADKADWATRMGLGWRWFIGSVLYPNFVRRRNAAHINGNWIFLDTNAALCSVRFYRMSLLLVSR